MCRYTLDRQEETLRSDVIKRKAEIREKLSLRMNEVKASLAQQVKELRESMAKHEKARNMETMVVQKEKIEETSAKRDKWCMDSLAESIERTSINNEDLNESELTEDECLNESLVAQSNPFNRMDVE